MAVKQVIPQIKRPAKPLNFNWSDNPAVKNLLDVSPPFSLRNMPKLQKKIENYLLKHT